MRYLGVASDVCFVFGVRVLACVWAFRDGIGLDGRRFRCRSGRRWFGRTDIDAKVDAITKLQAEFEAGSEVCTRSCIYIRIPVTDPIRLGSN